MNVNVGEDDEYEVLHAHHAAGGKDDDDGQGVELPEREEVGDGGVVDVLRGGGDGLFGFIFWELDVVICWPYTT